MNCNTTHYRANSSSVPGDPTHEALTVFAKQRPGGPWKWPELHTLAKTRKLAGAEHLLNAFTKTGRLVDALAEAPKVTPRYQGRPDDIVAQAEALFRQQRSLRIADLLAFHRAQGGLMDRDAALTALFHADWNQDDELLYPLDVYVTGKDLWARHDHAAARASTGDVQAALQVRRLVEAIRPAVFEDISDISPLSGYIPLPLLSEWMSDTMNRRLDRLTLERAGGLLQARGFDYIDLDPGIRGLSAETIACLGWLNHDLRLFKIERERRKKGEPPLTRAEREAQKQSQAEKRARLVAQWTESFRTWVGADEVRREMLVRAYNRAHRGRIVPTYTPEPLDIARWGERAPKLKPHQIAGARRILENRGGLLAFDVGVGKTYTAIAVVAQARQSGWVRRPVVLVPGSLVWKWHDDFQCTLPDYRILVIGSNRKRITRGERKGLLTSETDTPRERAAKWVAFQAGLADVVILSFDALGRTRMNEEAVQHYVDKVGAVGRMLTLRRRNLLRGKLTERDEALLEHGTRAWVEETLRLPKDQEYDPGVVWDELGIDMLVVDEAAAFKNLYMPQPREDGVPKFMGSAGEGSGRAWQLDFRAAAVRRHTGGAGIVLLTATPAKNSPLEFYNILQFIDPKLFTDSGIHDPEQFIDAFLRIERRYVLDTSFNVTQKPAVVGFKRLDDLRTLIYTLGEFRSAAEVGLKLPRPVPQIVTVELDDAQESKYERYVREIEECLEKPSEKFGQILGLLARLSLVALHAELDEGYSFKNALGGGSTERLVPEGDVPLWVMRGWQARSEPNDDGDVVVRRELPPPSPQSPKFIECARRIAASPHCGHIIFCEPTATHQWIRQVLVEHGIPRGRIAILNADETAPADRIRIAREFNGLRSEAPAPGTCAGPSDEAVPPKYDVVIANSVAYEGVDLQVRTCVIHHIDLPWTSSDLEQRNGRAVRQGNTLGTVSIYYYFADRSTDGYRFSLIEGKATWLADLLRSDKRDTSNPAAQQQISAEDILVMISRDKERTLKVIEEKKAAAAKEARERIAREAARLLRQASGRFRDARNTQDPERARRLREEAEVRLSELALIDADAWPWAPWMYAVRDTDFIVPNDGGPPLFEGLRVAYPRAGAADVFDHLEFGRVLADREGEFIGRRAPGSPSWELVPAVADLRPQHYPHESSPSWPADDEAQTEAAIERRIAIVYARSGLFEDLGWEGASDAWLARWWPRFGARLALGLARSRQAETVPVLLEGKLSLQTGSPILDGTILPPTRVGWEQYLSLAPTSGHTFTEVLHVGEFWWHRRIPQTLMAEKEPVLRDEANTAGPETEADAQEPNPAAHIEPEPSTPAPNITSIDSAGKPDEVEDTPESVVEARPAARSSPKPSNENALSWADRVLHMFNREAGPRLTLQRRRADGVVFGIFAEGRSDLPLASIDVTRGDIEDVRWMHAGLRSTERSALQARLQHALDTVAKEDSDGEPSSPLEELVTFMRNRGLNALGVDPAASQDVARSDGYGPLAQALRDLADPTGMTPADMQTFLERMDLMAAADVAGQITGSDPFPLSQLARRLWEAIDEDLPLGPPLGAGPEFAVTQSWLFDHRGDRATLLVVRGQPRQLRPIGVRVLALDEATEKARIEDPSGLLGPKDRPYSNDHSQATLVELYEKVQEFEATLTRAPQTLEDVRRLLFWTAAMLDAPRCQGNLKEDTYRSFKVAQRYYETARKRLLEGRTGDAVRQMHEALRRISTSAAELAMSCAEGQLATVTPAPTDVVRAEDAAAFAQTENPES